MSKLKESRFGVLVEWKIAELFSKRYKKNDYEYSDNFGLCGAHYYLKIFPNTSENTADDVEWVSVYLKRSQKSYTKHRVSFTVGIRSLDGSTFRSFRREAEFEESQDNFCTGYGESRFLRTSELKESKALLSLYDSLTIFCIAYDLDILPTERPSITEMATQTVSLESIEILQNNLKDLALNAQHDSDVNLIVKGQKIPAHRLILGARSRVFSAMFKHDTEEKRTGVVNIEDYEPSSVRDFLTFIYTGSADVVSSGNSVELFKIADKYDMGDLKSWCVQVMDEKISLESFFEVAPLATVYNEPKLLETALEFFCENSKAILQNPKWQSFIFDNFTLANEFLIKMAGKNG